MSFSYELLSFADRASWRRWLEAHHADASEARLVHPKRGAERYARRYTPRRPVSVWSARHGESEASLGRR